MERFGPVLVAQVLSLGMEGYPGETAAHHRQVLRGDGQDIAGIYLRNDVALQERRGWHRAGLVPLPGEAQPRSHRGGCCGKRHPLPGGLYKRAKTGFFLDQKYNRRAVARLAKGPDGTGLLHPYRLLRPQRRPGRARHVTAVDVSEFAVECAAENARRNGLDGIMECRAANVFDLLPELERGRGLRLHHSGSPRPSPRAARPLTAP